MFGQPVTTASVAPSTASATTKRVDPFAKTDSNVSAGMFGKKIEDQLDSSIYSLIESLTAVDIEAFRAPEFELGKIPEKPPPKELCVQ